MMLILQQVFRRKGEGFKITRNDASKAVFGADGSITQQSDLIFLGGGLENNDTRSSRAVFVEAAKDMNEKLQLKAALRYEDLDIRSNLESKSFNEICYVR